METQMTPNKIAGMRLRGIGRAPQYAHLKKEARTYLKYMAAVKKDEREKAQFVRANRRYAL